VDTILKKLGVLIPILLTIVLVFSIISDYSTTCTVKALPNGEIIWVQTNNPSIHADFAYDVAVDDSGLYIVGYDQIPGQNEWRIEKRNLNDGSIIWTQTNNPSTGLDTARGVAVDSSGLYIVGYDASAGIGDTQWRIEKRSLIDGSLISTFGIGGVITNNPSSFRSDEALGVVVDSSGLYVVGFDSSPGIGDTQWRIEKRNLNDGSIIWTQTNNPSSSYDYAYDVVIDSSGLYIVGYDSSLGTSDAQWRIEKRRLIGSIVWTQTNNPSSGSDVALGVAVDSSGLYIVGYDSSVGDIQWRIEKKQKVEPVGGIFTPVNRFAILTPFIVLVSLMGAISTIFAIRRWSKD
jgi:hypothetical protein